MRATIGVILSVVALTLCFISVPLLAAYVGGWIAYWGALAMSVIWAAILLWLKLTKMWEGDD
ncbi:MAG: hypothetical protein NO516_01335 [Candidatus Methanomethylicia archaeon]|nr:hypothetical protein [Candidatus Methanomethylicia archaeon]